MPNASSSLFKSEPDQPASTRSRVPPSVIDGHCSLCHGSVSSADGTPSHPSGEDLHDGAAAAAAVLEAELRAVKTRLKSLNEYVQRLTAHQEVLVEESVSADESADAATRAVDEIVNAPAPWLAIRDGL